MNTLTWEQYRELALKTEAVPALTIHSIQKRYGVGTEELTKCIHEQERATRLIHAAAGLVTETQELADSFGAVNIIEEIGDCWWYIPIFADCGFAITYKTWHSYREQSEPLEDMQTYAAELLNLTLKRHVIYGKELEEEKVQTALIGYLSSLQEYIARRGLRVRDIWEANIEKLKKRYPDGRFDLVATSNRNVEKELDHIRPSVLDGEDTRLNVLVLWNRLIDGVTTERLSPDSTPEVLEKWVENYFQLTGPEIMALIQVDLSTVKWKILATGDTESIVQAYPSPMVEVPHHDSIDPVPTFTIVTHTLLFEALQELGPKKGLDVVATWALQLSSHFRIKKANCMAEGFKKVYLSVMEQGLSNLKDDAWELYVTLCQEEAMESPGIVDIKEVKAWLLEQ